MYSLGSRCLGVVAYGSHHSGRPLLDLQQIIAGWNSKPLHVQSLPAPYACTSPPRLQEGVRSQNQETLSPRQVASK